MSLIAALVSIAVPPPLSELEYRDALFVEEVLESNSGTSDVEH
jgi:hypothetical protein